jgi:hypothetical protein
MTPKLLHRNLFVATVGAALIAGAAAMPPASAQSGCDGLGGTIDANQVCQVHSTTPAYTLGMSVPLDYPDQQAVFDYLTQDRADFLNWLAKFAPDGRTRPYMHDVSAKTYRSGTPESGTQSLVLDIDDDTGFSHEDHPNTYYKTFNYDLNKRAPITFDTLFRPGTNPLGVLNPIVQRELGKHPSTPVRDDLDANTYRNFAITDDAVVFFFGEDQVVADNSGPHRVSVPRSELAPLLA